MRLREPAAPVAEVSLTSGDPVAGERFVNGVGKCADNIGRERQPAQIDQALQDPGRLGAAPAGGRGRGGRGTAPSYRAGTVRLRDR